MLFLIFVIANVGLIALALAMHRHHGDVLGGPDRRGVRSVLRAIGWTLLVISAALCVARFELPVGPVVWLGLASLAGLSTVLLVTYWSGRRRVSHMAST